MSWEDLDRSAEEGEPFYLFRFFRSTGEEWLYTNQEAIVIISDPLLAGIYDPLEIEMGNLGGGSSDHAGSVDIKVPTDSEIGTLFQQGSITEPVDIHIWTLHRTQPTLPKRILIGEVLFGSFEEGVYGSLTVAPLQSLLDTEIPQGTMQRNQCIWRTYHLATCGVDIADFTFAGVVSAISSNLLDITVPGALDFIPGAVDSIALDDMFALGTAEVVGKGKVGIRSQAGDIITLRNRIRDLAVDDEIILVAGDDHMPTTCRDKFKNARNMMVHPSMPHESPWVGHGLRV